MDVYYIKSLLSTGDNPLFLSVKGQKVKEGSYIVTQEFKSDDTSQQWIFDSLSQIRSFEDSNLVLTVKGNKRGSYVYLTEPNGSDYQKWEYDHQEQMIISKLGKMLDVKGESVKPNTDVIVWDKHGKKNQKWLLIKKIDPRKMNALAKKKMAELSSSSTLDNGRVEKKEKKNDYDSYRTNTASSVVEKEHIEMRKIVCPKCKGECGYGKFGPCPLTSQHFKSKCPTCDGSGETYLTHPCPKCHGKGGIGYGSHGPCEFLSLYCISVCDHCKGKCYMRS